MLSFFYKIRHNANQVMLNFRKKPILLAVVTVLSVFGAFIAPPTPTSALALNDITREECSIAGGEWRNGICGTMHVGNYQSKAECEAAENRTWSVPQGTGATEKDGQCLQSPNLKLIEDRRKAEEEKKKAEEEKKKRQEALDKAAEECRNNGVTHLQALTFVSRPMARGLH